jgi:hypothetical protein
MNRLLLVMLLAILPDVPVGVVEGTVTNEIGTPMSEVNIRLRHTMNGAVLQTTSDQTGAYLFKDVPQGRYSLWASAEGYGSVWVRELVVNAGERVRHDIRFRHHLPTLTSTGGDLAHPPQ